MEADVKGHVTGTQGGMGQEVGTQQRWALDVRAPLSQDFRW